MAFVKLDNVLCPFSNQLKFEGKILKKQHSSIVVSVVPLKGIKHMF